jgi:hypothetical protein
MTKRSAVWGGVGLAWLAALGLVGWRLAMDSWPDAAAVARQAGAELPGPVLYVVAPAFHHREVRHFAGVAAVGADSVPAAELSRYPSVVLVTDGAPPEALAHAVERGRTRDTATPVGALEVTAFAPARNP